MASHERRPPSGRDFAVFEAVVVGGRSTREAAEQFKLSQTRVCQLVERVREWEAEVWPATRADDKSGDEQRRLQLAKIVAAGRLDLLYSEMMQAWRSSRGEVKKLRSTRFGDDVTTTYFSAGDPKYALAAARLAKAAGELGVFGGLAYPADEDDEEGTEGGRESLSPDDLPLGEAVADKDSRPLGVHPPGDTGRPEARPTNGPPVEDCSQNGREQPKAPGKAASASVATAAVNTTSGEQSPQQCAARKQFFGPVQRLPVAREGAAASVQIQVTPEQLGLSVEEVLGRQPRRARARASG